MLAASYEQKLTSDSASDDDFLRSAFALRRTSDGLVTVMGGTLVVGDKFDVLTAVDVATGLVSSGLLMLAACSDAPAFSTSSFVAICYDTTRLNNINCNNSQMNSHRCKNLTTIEKQSSLRQYNSKTPLCSTQGSLVLSISFFQVNLHLANLPPPVFINLFL